MRPELAPFCLLSGFCVICKIFQDLTKILAERLKAANGFHFKFEESPTNRKRKIFYMEKTERIPKGQASMTKPATQLVAFL